MFKQLQSHSDPHLRKRNSIIQCHRVAIEHLPVTDVRCLHESTILSARAIGKSNFDLAARVSIVAMTFSQWILNVAARSNSYRVEFVH